MFILLSLSGVTNLSLLAGVCAACRLVYKCLQMKWWAAVTVVAIPRASQKALLMCPYVSPSKSSVLAPRCSRALLHSLQPTSDRRLIFASHLATGMIPAIAIISDLLCLQGTSGSSKYFLINALLSFCRNNFCRPRAICRVIHIVLLCPSSKTRFQECSVINPSVLLTFTML